MGACGPPRFPKVSSRTDSYGEHVRPLPSGGGQMEDLVQPTYLEIGGDTIHPNLGFGTLLCGGLPDTRPLNLFGLKHLQI